MLNQRLAPVLLFSVLAGLGACATQQDAPSTVSAAPSVPSATTSALDTLRR